ncbi:hypothetical protein RchiOBHm_Chr3g0458101 [Rosa chinensis]|uniref:Uncharacterized protein n=1 Tax=Rosa chinensis TaxID=74649 RepID=A0A2P6R7T4_ROSCH|nr:hypothetical protein RchiOBHm_Chr3g0458101 [Rosa chinensis]
MLMRSSARPSNWSLLMQTHVKRSKLPLDGADFVMEDVPLLTNLLQYHDAKVLEHASVCLTRIAESFSQYFFFLMLFLLKEKVVCIFL